MSLSESCFGRHFTNRSCVCQVWGRDFWCVTPCSSSVEKGAAGSPGFDKEGHKLLEGTRLTIQAVPPEGFEFSIRTPGTPPRWLDFERELAHVWSQLEDAVAAPTRNLDRVRVYLTPCANFAYDTVC